jgi:hypothetical protein
MWCRLTCQGEGREAIEGEAQHERENTRLRFVRLKQKKKLENVDVVEEMARE